MFLKIFNFIFYAGMIFFLGGITLSIVMEPELGHDEFWIYFYGSAYIISGVFILGWYFRLSVKCWGIHPTSLLWHQS